MIKLCKGKKMLNLGCGTGIFIAFAIKSGAKDVFSIDNADVLALIIQKFKVLEINLHQIFNRGFGY
jgi:ribosomal protein L11 methylase PrmA